MQDDVAPPNVCCYRIPRMSKSFFFLISDEFMIFYTFFNIQNFQFFYVSLFFGIKYTN